ncbi:ABC transporter permease [Spirochaetia bacterium]|nr:ABC transporter permease [Spirochaetia bacterium]
MAKLKKPAGVAGAGSPFLAGLAAIVMLWQLGSWVVGTALILPPPLTVLKKLLPLVKSPVFLSALAATFCRLLLGMAISLPAGVICGLIAGLDRRAAGFFRPFFSIIAATPVMSVILIAFLAFGAEKTPVFTAFLMIFPVITANTIAGIQSVDPKLKELVKIYDFSRGQKLKYLYLPSILPFLAGGLRSALSLGWKVVVAAEVLVQPLSALGSGMQRAKANLETTELFAWTAATIIACALTEAAFTVLFNRASRFLHLC